MGVVQALVVVDMQEDFFNDTELRRCRDDVVRECNRLIERAGAARSPVIMVRTLHKADRSTWTLNMLADGRGMTVEGEEGSQPVTGLEASDLIEVSKTRDSAFFGTGLEEVLHAHAVRKFALCGVSTESCIAATAIDAYAHDFEVTLVDRATASVDEDLHTDTLRQLADQYRQPVLQPDEVAFTSPDTQARDPRGSPQSPDH